MSGEAWAEYQRVYRMESAERRKAFKLANADKLLEYQREYQRAHADRKNAWRRAAYAAKKVLE
jgi:hypothetical protein